MKKEKSKNEYKDDGRVVADMSDIEPQPILFPKLSSVRRAMGGDAEPETDMAVHAAEPVDMSRDDRRVFIGGALAAGLLVVGIIAAAFAALILLISHMG